ncbi:hypothetical protein EB796_002996 [Bugula neritina]|uniref:Uncharacterized protein n=1 Tax=Bugula neritina TaxID=10212 RepID=A0A7J7KK84_BUGNE|nr:hypothetical protein EB796_002996 [Bugula neritina]
MLKTNTIKQNKYTAAKSELQKYTRKLKSDWWEAKAKSLQQAADINDMKSFYGGLREVYGPVKRGTSQLTALDGNTVLQEKSEILNRFADHFAQLLNVPGTLDIKAAIDIETRPEVHCLSEPAEVWEVIDAIDDIREGKAPGKCRIPSEIWKHGGAEILSKLHQLILSVWRKKGYLKTRFGEEESRDVLGKFDNFSEKTSNKTIKKHQLLSTKQECLSIDEYVTNLHRL